MTRKRQTLMALGLGALGILGLAVIAAGQAADLADARKQYSIRQKQLADDAGAEDHYALAKWCLKNGLKPEALSHAQEVHKKNPEDVRAKYLIYLLSGAAGAATDQAGGGDQPVPSAPGGRKAVTLSAEEAKAVIDKERNEGRNVVRQFRSIQRILVRRCGDPKCHGGTGNGAKWVLAMKGPTDDRMLAQNFQTVEQYFDREHPEESPFVKKPLVGQEAGHPEKVIRGKTDPIYQEFVRYIDTLKTRADTIWEPGQK